MQTGVVQDCCYAWEFLLLVVHVSETNECSMTSCACGRGSMRDSVLIVKWYTELQSRVQW